MSTVKVRVLDGWAVSYDGGPHRTGGDLFNVDMGTATQWVAAGWVEPVTKPTTKPTTKRRRGGT